MAKFNPATLWTIVPVRGLAEGKSRLAPVLSERERVALNRELLLRTLAVVGEWCGTLQRCIVVSPCLQALTLARGSGAETLREGARPAGLNRAVRLGAAGAAAQGATHVLIVPGDLPQLGAEALQALVDAAGTDQRIVLAPDRSGTGTNALLIGVDTGFEYAFGRRSFAAHQAAARRAGLAVSVVHHASLEFDLDTPADYERWLHQRPRRTATATRMAATSSR